MIWKTWRPALALGAALAWAQAGGAEERDTLRTAGGTAATMTLGGTGTAAQAAAEDNELTHGYRRRGGYYGWGGGYGGYRGGYYGGGWGGYRPHYHAYRGGWGGYRSYYNSFSVSTYRPAFYSTPVYYSAPVYSYYPAYHDCYDGWGGYGYGSGVSLSVGFGRIGASAGALSTPTIPLGSAIRPAVPAQPLGQPMAVPAAPGGTFPYDGGPANPVPLPAPDANPAPPPQASATDLPVSLKPKLKTSPYRYRAYGEK
jgi:hypothetical protein